MKKAIRIIDGIFALCLVIIYSLVAFGDFVLPDKITAYSNKRVEYKSIYWLGDSSLYQVDFQNNSKVSPSDNDIKLLGIIPVKTASVVQKKAKKVNVSGESFGIKLYTDGVIIVGIRDVETDSGKCNPAIDIGSRQKGRYDEKMLKNIQHAREDKADILDKLQNISSHRIPSSGFGVGNSTELFFEVLKQEDIWNLDIQKIFVDIRGLKR